MNQNSLLLKVRLSEIQAIAIYEAEVFWIRNQARREFLIKILDEERNHRDALSSYGETPVLAYWFSIIAGWILGTLFSVLPWKLMCKLQAWAEEEAARIYETAEIQIKSNPSLNSGELHHSLMHARDQEREHARILRLVTKTDS